MAERVEEWEREREREREGRGKTRCAHFWLPNLALHLITMSHMEANLA